MLVSVNTHRTYSCKGLAGASREEVVQLINDLMVAIDIPSVSHSLIIQDIANKKLDASEAYQYAATRYNMIHNTVAPALMQSPEFAYKYAKHIMKSRWHTAEDMIRTNDDYWDRYTDEFFVKPVPV